MAKPVAVIVGASSKLDGGGDDLPPTTRWGLGGALAMRFAAGGFHTLMLGRRTDVMEQIASEIRAGGAEVSVGACDVTSDDSVKAAFELAKGLGEVQVVIYNISPPYPPGCEWPNFPAPHEVTPEYMQMAFECGVTGCVRCVRQCMPEMLAKGQGTFLISGATMALRGGAKFGFMAPVKAALRSYGQSMFQEYGPQGVHVAHVIMDGVIDSPGTHDWDSKMLLDPKEIAEQYWNVHSQTKTVWSYELQITPFQAGVGMRM